MTTSDTAAGPTALIAEDEPLLAAELAEHLASLWPRLRIVASVGDGAAALQAVEVHAPQVAFLDIRMPRLNGLDVARRIAGRCHAPSSAPTTSMRSPRSKPAVSTTC